MQVSPSTAAYHVQVNYAEDEEVIEKASQCDPFEGDEISEGTEWEELPVIFKLVQATQKKPLQIMRWPNEYFLSCLLGEVENMKDMKYDHAGQVFVGNTASLKTTNEEIRTQKCPTVKTNVSTIEILPRIRVKTEHHLPYKPIQSIKYKKPEKQKMKIKFSTCTVIYHPAQPVYENYKERRSSNPGIETRLPLKLRASERSIIGERRPSYF